ncbi:MAG: ACT domain-containing protein [Chloroflexota bacterium]
MGTYQSLVLRVLPDVFAVCRLGADEPLPEWSTGGPMVSITRTPEELSFVCLESNVPEKVRAERDRRCFKVEGPLDFGLTGVLASLVTRASFWQPPGRIRAEES